MKIGEYFKLLILNTKVSLQQLWEYGRVIVKYYPHWKFAKIDLSLLSAYFWSNPFRMSRRFLQKRGEADIYAYGETPLTTLDGIAKDCHLTPQDKVFELGCGRGRTCFWLNQLIGCSVVGIDFVPPFIEKANKIKRKFKLDQIELRCEDFLQTDFTGATVIYLYGTCMADEQIALLARRLAVLDKRTKIITVSYPLTDYSPRGTFKLIKTFEARFPWGVADVYLHQLNK